MIGFLVANLVPQFVPENLRKAAAWAIIAVAAVALLASGWAILKSSIISDHEKDRAVKAIDARDKSAEDRADDAVRNILSEKDREARIAEAALKEAAKPETEHVKLPPTTVAANCERLEKAYSASELAKIPAYKELCQ